MKNNKNFLIGAIIAGVFVVGGLIGFVSSTVTIQPGYAGILYDMNGGVEKTALPQGWHLISPFKKVISYPVSTETVFLSKSTKEGSKEDDSFDPTTASGKSASTDASYSYHMDANDLSSIFTKFKGQDATVIEANFMRAEFKSAFNAVCSQYDIMDYYGAKRPEVAQKVFDMFKKDMGTYGVIIENVNILAVRPDAASLKAIQDKVDAEQKLQQSKIDQQKAVIDAATALVVANGAANAKVATAQGEATANKALLVNMTPELIQYKSLEVQSQQAAAMSKWTVSTYVSGGSGATPFLNIPAATTAVAK